MIFRMTKDEEEEERKACYERYRILVQNECTAGKFAFCPFSWLTNYISVNLK